MEYSSSDREKLRVQVQGIALSYGISIRSKAPVELVAILRHKQITKVETEILKKFCEAFGVNYNKLKPPKKPRRKWQ